MAIQVNTNKKPPVQAVLKVDMVVAGDRREAGEVVELSHAEFKRFEQYDRVAVATPENLAEIRKKLADDKKAAAAEAAKNASTPDAIAALRQEIDELRAELATLKKK